MARTAWEKKKGESGPSVFTVADMDDPDQSY